MDSEWPGLGEGAGDPLGGRATPGTPPLLARKSSRFIRSISDRSATAFLVEQNVKRSLGTDDCGHAFFNGRVVAEGSAELLRADAVVRRVPFGS